MEPQYVLITAARNEEAFIEKTLKTVIAQSCLPEKWIIISDGSTDRTDEIVSNYADQYEFIQLARFSGDRERNFGSKAKAFNYGCTLLKNIEFDFIGNLDADIVLPPGYYESILAKFKGNNRLGIAGGTRYDLYKGKLILVRCAKNSVGGPVQMFRRECLETIGGYTPLKYGGIDAVAEISARMQGWEVESFPEVKVYHYRSTGSAAQRLLISSLRFGVKFYSIGYDPLFHTLSMLSRTLEKPVLSSLISLYGYFWAALLRYKRPVSQEFINYLRSEQRQRIQSFLWSGKAPALIKHS